MTKIAVLCLVTIFFSTVISADVIKLKNSGNSLKELVPDNWKIIKSFSKDLNKDNNGDLIFIIQDSEKSLITINEEGYETINNNPRILAIYFKNTKTNKFEIQIQSNNLIPLKDSDIIDEPLEDLLITKKGTIQIKLRESSIIGSWTSSGRVYTFRYQNKDFFLIGYDESSTHRGFGEWTNYSINFLTKKMITKTGKIEEDKFSTDIKKFDLQELKKLRDFKQFHKWEFLDLYI